ncbi:MAG TPA: hypothetical protein VNO35_12195 [Steroidobacteraceae bacterium]|nr:hypothetical protein [Steroidobacteraceae bacterium]
MQIDALAMRMRPRSPMEAADLGVRLCQSAARQVYRCYWLVGIPVVALCLATYDIAGWLPGLLIWWSKPWLDRTILFVLSRAAFGQATTIADLLQAQRRVWWSQLFLSLTTRRLSPWRSFTQSVYQLEGLPLLASRKRVLQLRRGRTTPATLMTGAFSVAETVLTAAVVSLIFWFTPGERETINVFAPGTLASLAVPMAFAYALVVLFLEPFYVAAGFAMYLNRRAQLEAWDIEQELRRAFQT